MFFYLEQLPILVVLIDHFKLNLNINNETFRNRIKDFA
jgi:hypothetical protein